MTRMRPFSIGISGKGGTGKTTIAALLVRTLIAMGRKPVLAVDADPNANLHEALGVDVAETLGSMREDAFSRSIPPGMSRNEYIRLRFSQVIVESDGFDLVAMGRPEGAGCYCFAHDLLTEAMKDLKQRYEAVIIDNEAGMEHISRGTVGIPDCLLVVTDPSARGMRTAARIRDIGHSLGFQAERMHLVVNRVREGRYPGTGAAGWGPVAVIPDDPVISIADENGCPLLPLPEKSPAGRSVETLAHMLEMEYG